MDKVYIGTKLKRNFHIPPMDGITMDSYDFTIEFISGSINAKRVIVEKNDAIRVDSDNYLVLIDTATLSVGKLTCVATLYIPDLDFTGGIRTEILDVDIDIELAKKP